jgi:hypothetical protein
MPVAPYCDSRTKPSTRILPSAFSRPGASLTRPAPLPRAKHPAPSAQIHAARTQNIRNNLPRAFPRPARRGGRGTGKPPGDRNSRSSDKPSSPNRSVRRFPTGPASRAVCIPCHTSSNVALMPYREDNFPAPVCQRGMAEFAAWSGEWSALQNVRLNELPEKTWIPPRGQA